MADSALFAANYDRLYAHKDYVGEVATVLSMYARWHGGVPHSVLDVGCGTGNHAVEFARRHIYTVGVDTDPDMIAVAWAKADGDVPDFHYGEVGDLEGRGFDLAVALFNVVNYVLDLDDLLTLFHDVAERLAPGGLFVVDAWNGVAATLDPPESGFAATDLLTGMAVVHKGYAADDGRGCLLTYAHRLWPPWLLWEAAQMAGLSHEATTPQMRPDEPAIARTWKITSIFRKAGA